MAGIESEHGSGAAPREGPILVVDDQGDLRTTVCQILALAGHQTAQATDGHVALDLVRDLQPALIILDLQMPRMSGEEFANHLRAWGEPSIPIILLSSAESAPEAARRMRAVAHVRKPFRVAELLAAVQLALRGQTDPPVPDRAGQRDTDA